MSEQHLVQVSDVSHDIPLYDRLFSFWVNSAQSSLVKAGVFMSSGDKTKARMADSSEVAVRLDALGLDAKRLWWGTMTLAPRKVRFLLDEIERQKPNQVLEVGAGTSTAVLGAAAARYGFDVLSLENHGSTVGYVRYLTEGVDLAGRVRMQKCGFVRRRYENGQPYRWYNADMSQLSAPIDFALIDGPMGTLVGRNGALPEMIPFLHPEHRIYLDDCKRPHEIACVEEWKRCYPGLEVSVPESVGIFSIKVPRKYLTCADS